MDRVHAAIEAGRCVIAVGGHLLRDAQVILALRDREALPSIALSAPVIAPARAPGADVLAPALAHRDGVLLLVEPEAADRQGLDVIANHMAQASNKPTVVVVSRTPNPLLFSSLFRGAPVQFEKDRGAQVLKKLPIPARVVPPPAGEGAAKADKAARGGEGAPRRALVGRDEEVPALSALLAEGGPLVVHGPDGVGRNTLIDLACQAGGLTRLDDVVLGRGAGFDTFVARIAELCAGAGSDHLAQILGQADARPLDVIRAVLTSLASAQGLARNVLVVQPLEAAAGRERDFFRKDRLAHLVQTLLAARFPLAIAFVGGGLPATYTHEASQALRHFQVGGIKGRFYHEIFESYHAPEFPRDKFGPMSERLHGHAMAVRQMAIEVRERENGLELVDDPKFLKADDIDDRRALEKVLQKRLDGLDEETRRTLAMLAHVRLPLRGNDLADLSVSRKTRLKLLGEGLLETVGPEEDKRYRVHPLVRRAFKFREIADFDAMVHVAGLLVKRAREADGAARLAYAQECNRNLVGARRGRDALSLKYPDQDPEIEAILGMVRSDKPHFQLAQQRVADVLRARPGNAEAHLLNIELLRRLDARREAIDEAYDLAIDQAPVAEVFQDAATWYLQRKSRQKAIATLEVGTQLLPDEVRLKTRLASLLLRDGRRNEALELLRRAMEQAPMLPDAYGLLGMARFDEGVASADEAEALLREAVRLAPADPVQIPRLVTMLLARARVAEPDAATKARAEARELLAPITRDDAKTPDGYLLLARLEREEGKVDRAIWLVKQARKLGGKDFGHRMRLEQAYLDIATGQSDRAEREMRDLVERDPSLAAGFVALSAILEARQQLIPAHGEMLRAAERTNAQNFDGQFVQRELLRLQALIEKQAADIAAGLLHPPEPYVPPEPRRADHQQTRVRRRRAQNGPATEPGSEGTSEGSGPAELDDQEAAGEGDDVGEGASSDPAGVEDGGEDLGGYGPRTDDEPPAE
jgi:tetratricopeptide (TPR) repeat protein